MVNAHDGWPAQSESFQSGAARFLVTGAAWGVVLFAMLRAPWFVTHAALPLTRLQGLLALRYGAPANAPVAVTLECGGADMMALCAGVILAYPSPLRRRLLGIAIVLPVLFFLNVVRIWSLTLVVRSPAFHILHVYVWPAGLILASAGLVLGWMATAGLPGRDVGRAAVSAIYTFGAFAALAPLAASSTVVAWFCRLVATSANAAMSLLGATASAAGPALVTPRGSFIVTSECVLSPVIPLWILATLWLPLSRSGRALALALTLPVVLALATARAMVLAAPAAWIDSPLIVVHGFHQLVLFAALVTTAAIVGRRPGLSWPRSLPRAVTVLTGATLGAWLIGPWYDTLLIRAATIVHAWLPQTLTVLRQTGDVQGALLMLPSYQIALLFAVVWAFGQRTRGGYLIAAASVLFVTQLGLLVALGEGAARWHVQVHALFLRGWAALVPLLAVFVVLRAAPADASGTTRGDAGYRAFWDDVGATFPDLGGAASTRHYLESEQRLVNTHVPYLRGKRVFKTDLWDEARNTRILQWMQQQGAQVFGGDISGSVIRLARAQFPDGALAASGADVRALPFRDRSFDVVYSMGTVEHFAETQGAINEIFRVVVPGGRAIIGVPNRHDPFLRPAMVSILGWFGLYDYGFEKSYTRRQLRAMLTDAGFRVTGDDGILFTPGWLRMLDLACHTRCRPLARITAVGVRVFAWIERRVPAVRTHGYLVVAVGERPRTDLAGHSFSPIGHEVIVDARGCTPEALRSQAVLHTIFAEILHTLRLTAVGAPHWHQFDGAGGLTGIQMLSESHLACHTYPEAGFAAFSLYCCRHEPIEWPWAERLSDKLGATQVSVRTVRRGPPGSEERA
jgi:S-adenosylmethionine decarboxylase